MKRSLLSAVLVLSFLCPLSAQPLRIVSVNVQEGEAGVPLVDSLFFTFNKKLPFENSWQTSFHWEPNGKAFQRYLFLDGTRLAPRYTIEHQPNTDYAVYVFGLRAEDGSAMERPFTLNYTTAATHGSNQVGGSVSFAERTTIFGSEAAETLRLLLSEALRESPAPQTNLPAPASPPRAPARSAHSAGAAGDAALANEVRRTVVFLLDRYAIDQQRWIVRAAANLDEAGGYTFRHVRDGVYFPVAINFATDEGDEIGAYGFYDPDGDFTPDPVTVSGGDVSGVALRLYPFAASTAFSPRALATSRITGIAPDARLLRVGSFEVQPGGVADEWYYEFHSPARNQLYQAFVDPISVLIDSIEALPFHPDQAAIPETGLIDSDEAMLIAEAEGGAEFRARHGDQAVSIAAEGGALVSDDIDDLSWLIWEVVYLVRGSDARLTVLVDMRSGAVIDPTRIATEPDDQLPARFALEQNYPNPFNPSTRISFELRAAGVVRLQVFDLLGREVALLASGATPAGAHEVNWDAGEIPSGIYLYRLEVDGAAQIRRMMLAK